MSFLDGTDPQKSSLLRKTTTLQSICGALAASYQKWLAAPNNIKRTESTHKTDSSSLDLPASHSLHATKWEAPPTKRRRTSSAKTTSSSSSSRSSATKTNKTPVLLATIQLIITSTLWNLVPLKFNLSKSSLSPLQPFSRSLKICSSSTLTIDQTQAIFWKTRSLIP